MVRREPPPFACPDPTIAGALTAIQVSFDGMVREVGRLADHQAVANHRLEKLEAGALVRDTLEAERARTEKVAQEIALRTAGNLKWVFMFGLGAAGVFSSVLVKLVELVW